MTSRRHLVLGSALLPWIAALPARAQAAPTRLLLGFPPGGTVDQISRHLSARLGEGVRVEARVGGGGRHAVEELMKAPADGSTLLLTPISMVTLYPHLYPQLGYGAADPVPVAALASLGFALGVGPAVPASVRTLADLVHAALIEHPRHLDPETGRRCEPERLIEHLALQRQMRARWPAQVQALGFSRWKRPIVQAFLQGSQVEPVRQPQQLDPARAVAVWGRRDLPGLQPGTPVLRLEDGFVRSVGLGAELVRPLSWIVDDLGLHFDASRPSRLEQLLQHHAFDEPLRRRAAILRQALIQAGLTKYNVGQGDWRRPEGARRVVLVPGQVETDASIRWGCAQVRDNAALLAAARRAEPGAWLVYKPHPDVLAGLRRGERDRVVPGRDCDEVVTHAPMHRLLDQVDAVHVMTSLAGFEALLRGREVVTWGLPFYAGWGLTEDHLPAPARRRRAPTPSTAAPSCWACSRCRAPTWWTRWRAMPG